MEDESRPLSDVGTADLKWAISKVTNLFVRDVTKISRELAKFEFLLKGSIS